MDAKTKARQMFCRHVYEKKELAGFLVAGGWLRRVEVLECRRCGKVKC